MTITHSPTTYNSCLGRILPRNVTSFFSKCTKTVHIVAHEAYATIKHILPSSIRWCYRKYISKDIKTMPLVATINKVTKIAYLTIHGKISLVESERVVRPLILLHGDSGHPFTMLKFADMAKKRGIPTFSLYLSGTLNDQQFELHQKLLGEAIDRIQNITQTANGDFPGVIGIGHSAGGILLGNRQFALLDPRLNVTCGIGARLNISDESECPYGILKSKIKDTYQGIVAHPELPIMQIVAKADWCVPQASMRVRPEHCYETSGMHLSGLYTKETNNHVTKFLNNSTSVQ